MYPIPAALLLFLMQISSSLAGNILFLPSMVSPSHKMGMVPLADTLAERGHHVLFWAAVASEDPYIPKKASWSQPRGYANGTWLNEMFVHKNQSALFTMPWTMSTSIAGLEAVFAYTVVPFCTSILENQKEEIKSLLAKKWDLIIIDELFNPCGYLISQLTEAPVVVYVSTSCLTPYSTYRNAQPAPRAYVPVCATLDGYSERMSFIQRAHTSVLWFFAYSMDIVSTYFSTRSLAAYYPEIKDLSHALTKPDMMFFYFNKLVDYAVPQVPNLVHVGGLHVKSDFKPIPANVQKVIDDGPKGFVLVSTGHWARFEYASEETKRAFIDAFRRVAAQGFSIIWQYKGDIDSVALPDRVSKFDWLPQRELLAHPKCKAFLSHCGCNSALEAVMNGVPLIGLGLFADQVSGAALLQAKGVSVRLDKTRLTADVIYDTVMEVSTNKTLHTKAKLFANMVASEPMKVMDKAIFWSEHLIRHKGGKWMRTKLPSHMTSAIKYYCIDVISALLAILAVVLVILAKLSQIGYGLVVGIKEKNRNKRE